MISKVKTELYNLIKELGYNITDNGDFHEDFPWLMLKTSGATAFQTIDTAYTTIVFSLDIFSTYSGEKEILAIIDNITSHLNDLLKIDKSIIYIQQTSTKILGDKATGPVRKHGIVNYSVIVASPIGEEAPDA